MATMPIDVAAHDIAALGGDGWAGAAADLLADLGFTLINSHRPDRDGSHLLVALRSEPTLRHFDPETLRYYAPRGDGRAAVTWLTREGAADERERRILWGHLHVIDRLAVENRFLTFGGMLRAANVDDDSTVLDLRSPGPIVRWGGHSQGADDLSGAIGAFFGRLIVPVDYLSGAETELDALAPAVLYAAFLRDFQTRIHVTNRNGGDHSTTEAWLLAEAARVGGDRAVWEEAGQLLEALGLSNPILGR